MLQQIKRLMLTKKALFIYGALVGFLIFVSLYGLKTVDPFSVNWILNIKGDVAQHYVGWLYYRNSPWHFPDIGQISSLAYPHGISVVYTDAIPLFAIFFKLFRDVLPATFQYLGIFTMLSFILQGGIAALLIRRFTKKLPLILLCSTFLALSPMVIGRSYAHTSLTAHWLILLAIYLLVRFKQDAVRQRTQIVWWAVLLCLATLIHAYFMPIVGVIFAISQIQQYRNFRFALLQFGIPLFCMVVVFWLIGGLSPGMGIDGDSGLGLYSLNGLALLIPQGYSAFYNTPYQKPQWEGLAYLGLGLIILIPIVVALFVNKIHNRPVAAIKELVKKHATKRNLLSAACLLVMWVAALSPIVSFGDHTLTLHVGTLIRHAWAIFRSTGRLFWPLYYLLILGMLVYLIRAVSRWKPFAYLLLLVPLVFIQYADILGSPAVAAKKTQVSTSLAAYVPDSLNSTFIKNYCSKKEVVIVDNSLDSGILMFQDLSGYIIKCQPALTSGYFARFPTNAILGYADAQRQLLISGKLIIPSDALYISQSKEFIQQIDQSAYTTKEYGNYWVISNRT